MKNEQQQHAQTLYLQTGATQQQIADILNVNRRTVYMWIKNGRWAEMKAAARQAPGIILQDMYNHISAINEKIYSRDEGDRDPTMQEVEKLRKLIGITTAIQKRNVGAYMEAFQELLAFIAPKDHELVNKILPHADNYVRGNMGDKIFHASKERDENVRDTINALSREEVSDTPPSPAGTPSQAGEQEERNEQSCVQNGSFSTPSIHVDNTSGSPAGIGFDAAQPPAQKTPMPYISGNETFPAAPGKNELSDFDKMMLLPPTQRVSPWRDGDTIWILCSDHLEYRRDNQGNEWGEEKMGDTVRHYPDVDPNRFRDQAVAQILKEMREEEERKRNRPAA